MAIELDSLFEDNKDRIVADWETLLRFPSISTDATYNADCLRCADWLSDYLKTSGFETQQLATPTKPVVYAERPGESEAPVVLIYGHYDVQPVDPLDAWITPPFEPTWREGRLFARGAEDNKGQHFYVLSALRSLIASGAQLPTLKIFLEGEEECGSGGVSAMLEQWKARLAADVLMVTDLHMATIDHPILTLGLRGIIHLTLTLSGPSKDLHSGSHGGLAPNPAVSLCQILATLHDDKGRIAVRDFDSDASAATEKEAAMLAATTFDEKGYQAATGVLPCGGEQAVPASERLGFRPALDINGLSSGFAGSGMKTIIPAEATAKITARLAAGQDPERCLESLVTHLQAQAPQGLKLTISEAGVGGRGFRVTPNTPRLKQASDILAQVTGNQPQLRWEGASIPIVAELAKAADAEPVLAGFGLEEDNIHAPNESLSLEQFRRGFMYAGQFLTALANG